MNALPLDFYDKIFVRIDGCWPSAARALSGPFGSLACEHYENHTVHTMEIKNGQVRKAALWCYHPSLEQGRNIYSENLPTRNLHTCEFKIQDESESEEESTTASKLPGFTNSNIVYLYLESPTISKASEKLIDSIRILAYLRITVPNTGQIQGILEKIVQKRTLGRIHFNNDHQFDEKSTKLVLDLLKQEQFDTASFSSGCNLSLKDVTDGWRENSEQMERRSLSLPI